MNSFLMIFSFTLIFVLGFIVLKKLKNKPVGEMSPKKENNNEIDITNNSTNELQVQFNMLSEISEVDESRLVEISDKELLGHVNNLLPETLKTATSVGNAVQWSNSTLYEVILPAGKQ